MTRALPFALFALFHAYALPTFCQEGLSSEEEAQISEMQEHPFKLFFRSSNLPGMLPNGKRFQIFHDGVESDASLRVEKDAVGNYKILVPKSPSGFPQTRTDFAVSEKNNQIYGRFGTEDFGLIDLDGNSFTRCERVPESGLQGAIAIQDGYAAIWGNDAGITLQSIEFIDGKCVTKTLTAIPTPSPREARIVNQGGKIGVYLAQSLWGSFTGSDSLEVRLYDFAGKLEKQMKFEGYTHLTSGQQIYPAPTYGKDGMLLPLVKTDKLSNNPDLYLLDPKGNLKPIAPGVLRGWWTPDGDILALKGKHANSSELVVYKAPQFDRERKFSQPDGYKDFVNYEGGNLWYHNVRADLVNRTYEAHDSDLGKWKEMPWESADGKPVDLSLKKAKIPATQEVTYPSGDRQVPSMLLLPQTECKADEKRPAVVYLHGGNFSGFPGGHNRFLYDSETLMFHQLGYVVLEANYYGDRFTGPEFQVKDPRYLETERHKPQLADIQAAGEYVKNLPCVDPKKILLLGHSYGAHLAGVFVTDKAYAEKSPYSGVILKNGVYTEADVMDLLENPRLAVRGTEVDRALAIPAEGGCIPIFTPTNPLIGLKPALELLESLEKQGKTVYGVPYAMDPKALDEIIPARRTETAHSTPIFVIQGNDGAEEGAKELAKSLQRAGANVTTWFPHGEHGDPTRAWMCTSGHNFSGTTEKEYLRRLRDFMNKTSEQKPSARKKSPTH